MYLPLLMTIVGLYLFATSMSFFYLRRLDYLYLRASRWALFLGLAVHLGFAFSWMVEKGTAVPSNSAESQLAITSLLALLCGALSLRRSTLVLNFVLLPLLASGLVVFYLTASTEVHPELPHSWLWTHIVLTVLGEAFLVLAAAVSFVYLIADVELKKGRVPAWMNLIPPLPDLDRLIGETLLTGFLALSLGVGLGVLFAEQFWRGSWALDPKVIFCFSTWWLYAIALSLRKWRANFKGRRSAWVAVLGFLAILFLSWGMGRIVPSQHGLDSIEKLRVQP